ncbi:hypothetical protein Hs30E_09510 [Lactococcus hodotermopsidis]|uniref:Uncharacterized protein n=1 Tax=Pseudolactococcus hodotermopsidis TaxID=2709157 RepID=A0A6A0BAB7_9LACT|nr:hypothetical protein [Lactococcus hodotermopsidis]GFH42400.1 hypothetical protein Hs30E_09510 [Lactococcus hodotermopsidis]
MAITVPTNAVALTNEEMMNIDGGWSVASVTGKLAVAGVGNDFAEAGAYVNGDTQEASASANVLGGLFGVETTVSKSGFSLSINLFGKTYKIF